MASQNSVAALTERAPFVFEGTVIRTAAATLSNFPVTPATTVVRIDAIVRAPPNLRTYAGREVTVQLRPRSRIEAGQRAVFFTEGLTYGDGLAVREIGRRAVAKAPQRMLRRIQETVADEPNRQLQRRIASADLVVTGLVTATEPVVGASVLPISEHDPRWQRATIAVDGVDKGDFGGGSVSINFPASNDVMWCRSPKLRPGDRGVFLLHRAGEVAGAGALARAADAADFAIVDPLDFQPIDQRDRVRALASTTP